MRRRQDWAARLLEFLDDAQDRPYAWGVHDCCMFTCDAVLAMTEIDLAAPFRGRYHDRKSAYRALRLFAGGGLRETAEKITGAYGCCAVPALKAQRGDVVLIDGGNGPTLGLVDLTGFNILSVVDVGYAAMPLGTGIIAWKIH